MDSSNKEGFLSKGKWIFSSLSGIIMLWASKLPSPMQIPKQPRCHLQSTGLKTLIYSQGHPLHQNPSHPSLIITSHMISSSLPPSPPSSESSLFRSSTTNSSSWCSAIDDFLGTESGVYMNSDYEQEVMGLVSDKSEAVNNNHYLIAKRRSQCSSSTNTMINEYPPPLPHMPRVLTRHYENGNLLLRYEGMQRYLDITRENGRLILNLVEDNNEEMLEVEGTELIKKTETDDEEVEYEATHYEGSITILAAASQQMPAKWCLEEEDDDVEYEATHYYEGSITILAAASQQMPAKWCLEEEEEEDEEERSCGELRKCLTYTGRRSTECVRDFGHLQPGSAPLSVTAHRVTPVM